MAVSFAGCGFIGVYHIGAASCLQTYAPFLFTGPLGGASAGAMAAAAIVGDVPLTDMAREVLAVVCKASEKVLGPFHPQFSLNDALHEGLAKVLPDDIHLRATDRLHISVTRLADRKNLIISQFESREHLIDTLLASSYVPLLSGWVPPRLGGELVFDGGYTDNVPKVHANTITVSPFSGDQDICPQDDSEMAELLNLNLPTGPSTSIAISRENLVRFRMAMLPPSPEELLQVCRQGFEDAYRYLSSRGIIQCAPCRAAKLDKGLTSPADWRRAGATHNNRNSNNNKSASCRGCEQLLLDADHRRLPADLCGVFAAAAADVRRRESGTMARLSSLSLAPYTISARFMGRTAWMVMSGVLPWEKTVRRLASIAPAIIACPFDSL